jgi:hypothetical protein
MGLGSPLNHSTAIMLRLKGAHAGEFERDGEIRGGSRSRRGITARRQAKSQLLTQVKQ